MALIVAGLALIPTLAPLAQRVKESQSPVNVTGVGVRQSGSGAVVTVSADAPLNRTQTWQDGDKFHLILPYAASSQLKNLPRGVRVNRVSNSLEIVVNMKSGASVTVDPRFNRLNLIVNGGLNSSANDADDETAPPRIARTLGSVAARETVEPSARQSRERNLSAASAAMNPFVSSRAATTGAKSLSPSSAPKQAGNDVSSEAPNQARPIAAPAESAPPPSNNETPATSPTSTQLVPSQEETLAPAAASAPQDSTTAATEQPTEAQSQTTQNTGLFSTIFSTTGVMIVISMALLSLVYLRLRTPQTENNEGGFEEVAATEPSVALEARTATAPVVRTEERRGERRGFMRRKSDKLAAEQAKASLAPSRAAEATLEGRAQSAASAPAVLFGAYRVDQEVGKLALGQPHRMDVLASRALDDRRAIETSLLKVMNSPETDADGRRRARQALEEYGFLARHSAALLLAQNPCERAAAARTLGEIGESSALPFLLEALYDTDASVRAQAVSGLGALKLPSAIGALLDMARRHPEMPAALLSQALSACSLDCLDIGGPFEPERTLISAGGGGSSFDGEITRLEPSGTYEQLPEFMEDETLAEAVERLENMDVEVRMAAARRLAQSQTQTSVAALTALGGRDSEAAVRAAAVASLGEIDHESVFAPVLMAFVDEAREVQAAAARALSRLSFNRADAYVRIIETADEETLRSVARACIKARMAAQAIDRLTSEDRRQAYEAFSLLSLLAKAGEIAPILDAIAEHRERNVQMAAIRLLGMTGRPEVAQQFRQLALRDGLPEQVRTSLLEVVYKIDQALPV